MVSTGDRVIHLMQGVTIPMMHWPYYLNALWKDWVSRMSGLASIVLAFIPVVFPSTLPSTVKAGFWIAAALCFVGANYRVWRATQPLLSVEVIDVYLGSGLLSHESLDDAYITIAFRMCAKSTTLAIKEIACSLKHDGITNEGLPVPCRTVEQWVGSEFYPEGSIDLFTFMASPLAPGWLKQGWLRFNFPNITPLDISGGRIRIVVRDSYDVRHVVKCKIPTIRSERDYGVFTGVVKQPTDATKTKSVCREDWQQLAKDFEDCPGQIRAN
jgi:hypothetical protein